MIGGKVIGIARRKGETLLHVQDGKDTCSVWCVEPGSKMRMHYGQIELGDSVWWQCGKVYWTSAHYSDVPLLKIAYSH